MKCPLVTTLILFLCFIVSCEESTTDTENHSIIGTWYQPDRDKWIFHENGDFANEVYSPQFGKWFDFGVIGYYTIDGYNYEIIWEEDATFDWVESIRYGKWSVRGDILKLSAEEQGLETLTFTRFDPR